MPIRPSAEALERRVHLAAAVEQVFVSGSAWQPAFKQYLQNHAMGSAAYGYAIPEALDQSGILP
jgi:hypothetical protein